MLHQLVSELFDLVWIFFFDKQSLNDVDRLLVSLAVSGRTEETNEIDDLLDHVLAVVVHHGLLVLDEPRI